MRKTRPHLAVRLGGLRKMESMLGPSWAKRSAALVEVRPEEVEVEYLVRRSGAGILSSFYTAHYLVYVI